MVKSREGELPMDGHTALNTEADSVLEAKSVSLYLYGKIQYLNLSFIVPQTFFPELQKLM